MGRAPVGGHSLLTPATAKAPTGWRSGPSLCINLMNRCNPTGSVPRRCCTGKAPVSGRVVRYRGTRRRATGEPRPNGHRPTRPLPTAADQAYRLSHLTAPIATAVNTVNLLVPPISVGPHGYLHGSTTPPGYNDEHDAPSSTPNSAAK